MDIRRLLFLITLMFPMKHAMSMRHLVYWEGKLIPELRKEGLEVEVEIDDKMDVLCPYYADERTRSDIPPADYLMLYNVTEYEFHSCDTRRGIRVQVCDDPLFERKLTIKFQERSPSPFGFIFRPGEKYYYISKPIGGDSSTGCTRNTLKMIVKVERKGTVFDPEDRSTTVYHDKSRNHHHKKAESSRDIGRDRESKHHHHHKSTSFKTTTTTASPAKNKPIFQLITTSKDSRESSRRKNNGPENAGYPNCYKCTNTILLTTLNIVVVWMLHFR